MGKTPAFGVITLCSLVLAGCNTVGTTSTTPKGAYQPNSTFGGMNSGVSKTTDNSMPVTTPVVGQNPTYPSDTGRSPGAAGLTNSTQQPAQVQSAGSGNYPNYSSGGIVQPVSAVESSRVPVSPSAADSSVSSGGSGMPVLPPPPGASSTMLLPPALPVAKPLPTGGVAGVTVSPDGPYTPRPTATAPIYQAPAMPPPPPPLPAGVKSNDGPPLPEAIPGTTSLDSTPPQLGKEYSVPLPPPPPPPSTPN